MVSLDYTWIWKEIVSFSFVLLTPSAMFAVVALALVASSLAFPAEVFAPNPTGQNWAVLVAGSNSWGNYRHQVCANIVSSLTCYRPMSATPTRFLSATASTRTSNFSFLVLMSHGSIIVMMYDDIARNSENPTQGIIINAVCLKLVSCLTCSPMARMCTTVCPRTTRVRLSLRPTS